MAGEQHADDARSSRLSLEQDDNGDADDADDEGRHLPKDTGEGLLGTGIVVDPVDVVSNASDRHIGMFKCP